LFSKPIQQLPHPSQKDLQRNFDLRGWISTASGSERGFHGQSRDRGTLATARGTDSQAIRTGGKIFLA
jgi:hypothetical protein